jgi:Domain of unknown function (DUF4326)
MTTELINLRTKDYNGKSGYFYYKQKYGSRFEYIGDKVRFQPWEASIWYNPFHKQLNKLGRARVVELYRDYITHKKPELLAKIPMLKNKVLACWCKPEPCHGDILIELINKRK